MNNSDKYNWDLTKIYKENDDFIKDLETTKEKIDKIEVNNTFENGNSLYNYLTNIMDISRTLEKLYTYSKLHHDCFVTSDLYQTYLEKVMNTYNDFSVKTSSFEPNLLKIDEVTLNNFYENEPKLKEFTRYIDSIYRYKKHTLISSSEKIISSLEQVLDPFDKIYSDIFDADIVFKKVRINDKNILIDQNNYIKYLSSKNRNTRIKVFNAMYDVLSKYKEGISSLLSYHVKSNNRLSKIKHYKSTLEKETFDDAISEKVYENLIETVNNNLDAIYEYYDFKKKVLKLDKLHLYDIYTDILDKEDIKKYSFEEGFDLVKKSLSVLGKEYIDDLDKLYNQRFIDIYPKKGKAPSAYSSGCYDSLPYLFLNYVDTIDDVSTLSHEIGHSMHTYYSNQNNSYQNSSYKIFVAEIASTVNELLFSYYMEENSKDKDSLLLTLNKRLDLYKGTLFRQTMFAEFEKGIYDYENEGNVITSTFLCEYYLNLNKKYFGKNVVIDQKIKYEWERIEHFFYNFYVYKYATGISIACFIVNNLLKDKNYKEKYLKFLKSGNSKDIKVLLKELGINLENKEYIELAIKMFKETLKKLVGEYNE